MSLHNTFVAGYAQRRLAEIDLDKMLNAGFELSQLRIVSHYQPALPTDTTPVLHSFGELEPEYYGCIPEHDIVDYEAELDTGRLFIVAHGTPDEVERAKIIADSTHPTNWDGFADTAVYYGCDD